MDAKVTDSELKEGLKTCTYYSAPCKDGIPYFAYKTVKLPFCEAILPLVGLLEKWKKDEPP